MVEVDTAGSASIAEAAGLCRGKFCATSRSREMATSGNAKLVPSPSCSPSVSGHRPLSTIDHLDGISARHAIEKRGNRGYSRRFRQNQSIDEKGDPSIAVGYGNILPNFDQ